MGSNLHSMPRYNYLPVLFARLEVSLIYETEQRAQLISIGGQAPVGLRIAI